MRSKTKVAAPTFAERQNSANAAAARAVSIFDQAVADLNAAAVAQANLAFEIDDEIQRLQALHAQACNDADAATDVADKIRALLR